MGGLVTDKECRVLDVRTYKPIPGLYAAGEATAACTAQYALARLPFWTAWSTAA